MEGWRQERLGSRAGTHREKEKNKNILYRKEKRKTYLTLTGLLMEGVIPPDVLLVVVFSPLTDGTRSFERRNPVVARSIAGGSADERDWRQKTSLASANENLSLCSIA
jgi:hypothetical protein